MKSLGWIAAPTLALTLGACVSIDVKENSAAVVASPAKPKHAEIVPACAADAYRDFDFWLGEWTVTQPDGSYAGHNSIVREEGGCLIVERWSGAGGSTGHSLNFYDPGMGKWRQVWVSAGSVIDYAGGLDEAGVMRLEGTIAYGNGSTFPFRGSWEKMDDGRVRQSFWQYNPQTEEWDTWFVGIYALDKD